MSLDINARRNLEITEKLRDRSKKGTLLWVLDKTSTSIHIDNNVNVFIQNVTIKNDDAEDTFNIYNYGNFTRNPAY